MAKNTAIGQRTKHVDIRYRFVNDMILSNDLWVEHIRSGDNPSDTMTKNLPLILFAKHATVISGGLLGTLYDPLSTEDVKVYYNTVYGSSTTVVDNAQYLEQCECHSATVVCPVHRSEPYGSHNWTAIGRKGKSERPGRLPKLQASTLDGFGSNG